MPPVLPAHLLLIYLSGVFEILFGVLLLIPKFSRLAAWLIIALLDRRFSGKYLYGDESADVSRHQPDRALSASASAIGFDRVGILVYAK